MAKPIKTKDPRSKTQNQRLEIKDQSDGSGDGLRNTGYQRPALSGWPMILGWLAMLIFALHASTHMVGAGDTWVAMACGRHFINHGVDTVEPFSANAHKAGPTKEEIKTWPNWAQWITYKVGIKTVKYWHPTGWVNQNWLTHVVFYWLSHLSPFADAKTLSFNTLVYWKFAIYIITVICVYYIGRLLGVNPALSAVFACFAMFVGRSLLDIRPAGFSNLLVAVFLLILVLATYRNILYIWLIVPLTVFWCNVHGGYIYVFIMLIPVVVLHLLTILSKRTTVSLHSTLTMLALYFMMLKFTNHAPLIPVEISHDRFLFFMTLIIITSFILTRVKVDLSIFYGYHILTLIFVFLILFARLFSLSTLNYNDEAADYIRTSRLSFFLASVAAVALGIVVTFLKSRLLTVKRASIWHIVAAGIAAFIASILFNPFHLTNLTHTYLISFSEHAKMWRSVNEWHPAFEWSNPVGQSFAFLVLFILSIGYLVFRFLIPLLMPRFLKAPKNELKAQEKRFKFLSTLFGYAAAVFICWITFISFSFVKADAASFLLCTMFVCILLLSIYKNVHFIYLTVPFVIMAVGFADPGWLKVLSRWFNEPDWLQNIPNGYLGRYIFPFVTLPSYVILHIFILLLSDNPRIKYKVRNISFVALSAVASLLLMILIFNPFNFKMPLYNAWEQFLNLHRLWSPEYERNLEITYEHFFDVLYIVNISSIVTWLLLPYLRKLFGLLHGEESEPTHIVQYELPKVDLPLMVVAALTIYMAYRSRRFIPIAAIAACPVIAMFISQIICTISAVRNFYKNRALYVSPMPYNLQLFFIFTGAVAVITFGIWWGFKFKYVYLDPSPTNARLNSIFMRMTASSVKPFDACKFIRDNKLKGKMFNYWTEGGFIAWGQEPDPNTGQTPLQLFMDGRAQAAYEPTVYNIWSSIMAGGPIAYSAMKRKTDPDYVKVGQWINQQLKKYNVWVVLMPLTDPEVYNGPFLKGLESDNPNWFLAFFNNTQKLFIDVTTPQGKELSERISNGKAIYPDEFSRDLILAYNKLGGTEKKQGLDFAFKAFKLNPSQAPMIVILFAAGYAEFQPLVVDFCKNYFIEFTKNKDLYAKQDGYLNRIWAALLAGRYLRAVAVKQGNIELAKFYDAKLKEYNDEQEPLVKGKRW
jgi:hypothetical protein